MKKHFIPRNGNRLYFQMCIASEHVINHEYYIIGQLIDFQYLATN